MFDPQSDPFRALCLSSPWQIARGSLLMISGILAIIGCGKEALPRIVPATDPQTGQELSKIYKPASNEEWADWKKAANPETRLFESASMTIKVNGNEIVASPVARVSVGDKLSVAVTLELTDEVKSIPPLGYLIVSGKSESGRERILQTLRVEPFKEVGKRRIVEGEIQIEWRGSLALVFRTRGRNVVSASIEAE